MALETKLREIYFAEILEASEDPSQSAEGVGVENVIKQVSLSVFIGTYQKTTKETHGERKRTKKGF